MAFGCRTNMRSEKKIKGNRCWMSFVALESSFSGFFSHNNSRVCCRLTGALRSCYL